MGIFLGATEKRLQPTFPERPIPPFPGADLYGSVSVSSKPDTALTVPTVWACVLLKAGTISSLPLQTYRKGPKIPLRVDDPSLIKSPSPGMTQSQWLHMVSVSLDLRGNAWGRITGRDTQLRATQVDILNPDSLDVTVDKDTGRLVVKVQRTQAEIPADDVWHLPGLTLPGMKVGLSPIQYAAATLGIDIYSRRFASDFFDGGGIPKAILKSAQPLDQDQARKVKDRLMAAIRAREPIVVPNGIDYVPIAVKPEESQFLATQQANVAQIARYFGIPPEMVGGSGGNSMCVDTETEMLTVRGWLRHDQIQVGDTCLTLNTETGLAEWQPVQAVYTFDGPHQVMRLENGTHSSVTTLNHRWPVLKEAAAQVEWRESQTMVSSDRILAAAPVSNLPAEAKWSDALVELVAWFYTEGWIGPHGQISIAQSHKVNSDKCARIRAAMSEVFGQVTTEKHVRSRSTWIETQQASGITRFRLNKLAAGLLLAVAPGKVPTMEFLTSLTRAQLELFVQVSIDADGSVTNYGTPVLGQKDLRRLEAFQVACVLAGKSGVIRQAASGSYFMAVQTTNNRKPKAHGHYVTVEQLDGVVWCPTTPNRTWFARRNGTTYFTGNTYANVEQRSLDFLTYGLAPWLKRIEDAISTLLPNGQYVEFDVSKLLRTDAETATRIQVQHLAGKVLAPSEIRETLGLPPMTDAQKAEADMVPLTITPLGGAKALPGLKLPTGPVAPVPVNDTQPQGA